jgi:hypothetical protein
MANEQTMNQTKKTIATAKAEFYLNQHLRAYKYEALEPYIWDILWDLMLWYLERMKNAGMIRKTCERLKRHKI